MELLEYTVFPEMVDRIEFAMIGLHGRDADKHAFFPFVRQMGFLHTQWTLPSAPFSHENAPGIRRWFDKETENLEQMESSRSHISQIIESRLKDGVAAENIFLVGFSQGAVMALHTALRYPQRLGGVVALSGYLALPLNLQKEAHPANRRIPVFIAHGTRDETLPVEHSRIATSVLREMGYSVDFFESDTGHRISSETVKKIRAFLHRHMYGVSIDDQRAADAHIAPF
ncbi:MAG: dienelactone hydrolase family protein [Ignavibacteriae bacterium]|nr:dienelactone hydrolase family protein [Ignavibacteriota bacterium]